MKNSNCYEGEDYVKPYQKYIALMILFNEHKKLSGNLIKFDRETLKKHILKYLNESLLMDDLINELLSDKQIAEFEAIYKDGKPTYKIENKAIHDFEKYKETKEYLKFFTLAENSIGRTLTEEQLFKFGSADRHEEQIAYMYFVWYLEKVRDEEQLISLGLK